MVRANNVVMRHELDQQMAKGGQMLAMAASGSQDLSLAAGLIKKARNAWLKRRGEEPPEETHAAPPAPLRRHHEADAVVRLRAARGHLAGSRRALLACSER